MKYPILLPLFCVILHQFGIAQSSDTLALAGRKAFEFSINGLNLGGALSARHWSSQDQFQRLSIMTSYHTGIRNEPLDSTNYNMESKDVYVGLSLAWGFRLITVDRLIAYSGCGATVSYEDEWSVSQRLDSGYSYRNIDRRVGLNVLIGFEYFVSRSISVSGEKTISAGWQFSSRGFRYFTFGNGNSALTASVYF